MKVWAGHDFVVVIESPMDIELLHEHLRGGMFSLEYIWGFSSKLASLDLWCGHYVLKRC